MLARDLVCITTDPANTVPDNLEKMYQRYIDADCNFDPWK